MKASATGSLLSDAMGGAPSEGMPPELEPVHGIHEAGLREAKEKFTEYTEISPAPVVIECPLGPARASEFTAKTSFGGKLHGWRGTIIGHDKGVTLFCSCPEADWQALQPVFEKVFASMERGTAE
jgi:hypothetical protein